MALWSLLQFRSKHDKRLSRPRVHDDLRLLPWEFYQEMEKAFHTHEIADLPVGGVGSDRSHIIGVESDYKSCHGSARGGDGVEKLDDRTVDTTHAVSERYTSQPSEVPAIKAVNLNMASAFSHISAYALRTTSVFIAACTASIKCMNGSTVDAWVAIVVSGTILFSNVPLMVEIYKSRSRLMSQRCDMHTSEDGL